MPRLTPAVIRQAARISNHLPLLLRECRDLRSAQNELRWMKETIFEKNLSSDKQGWTWNESSLWSPNTTFGNVLQEFVNRRSRGEPLQYILGTQPFGDLDIKCTSGVLIPRPETETYATEVGSILRHVAFCGIESDERALRLGDFCSGSGCIALLLHSMLKSPMEPLSNLKLNLRGFDISQQALKMAKENLQHNLELGSVHEDAALDITFEYMDVLALGRQSKHRIHSQICHGDETHLDVIVSNPPYISPADFRAGGPTSKSVRRYEPRLALVPPEHIAFDGVDQADQFYVALLRIAAATHTKLLVMEVGDTAQALRIRKLCREMKKHVVEHGNECGLVLIEIWKDDGSVMFDSEEDITESLYESSGEESQQRSTYGGKDDTEDTPCRAVVMWFDSDWIRWRQRRTSTKNMTRNL